MRIHSPIRVALVAVLALLPVRGPGRAEAQEQADHRLIFVGIGIANYDHWQRLQNAPKDVENVGSLLHQQFQFEVPPEYQLSEKNATRDKIMELLDVTLHRSLRDTDDLVLMYSGHGTRRTDQVGGSGPGSHSVTRGFIVPVGAASFEEGKWNEYIDLKYFLEAANSLPARHILIILDSCNSGLADERRTIVARKGPTLAEKQLVERVGRNVIASAQADEEAADRSTKLNGNSPFASSLMDALKSQKADPSFKGWVAGRDLGNYVAHDVGTSDDTKQNPLAAPLPDDEGGDVLFRYKFNPPAKIKQAVLALEHGDLPAFSEAARELTAAGANLAPGLWAQYRTQIAAGEIQSARASVNALREAIDKEEDLVSLIPNGQEIGHVEDDIDAMKNFIGYKIGKVPLRIEIVPDPDTQGNPLKGEPGEKTTYFTVPPNKPFQIVVWNDSKQTVHVDSLEIYPNGEFSHQNMLGKDIAPGSSQMILVEKWSPRIVHEWHMYSSACIKPDATGCQIVLQVQALKKM